MSGSITCSRLSISLGSLDGSNFGGVAAQALAFVVAVDRMAPAVLDAVDQRRLDALAAIGQHGIGGDHAHDRGFARAERHRR